MPLGFGTNNGPIRFDHERVELIKGIDTPNGKAHFVVALRRNQLGASAFNYAHVKPRFWNTPSRRVAYGPWPNA
jgi:hypothetical protein